jgi:hypothetical protein
VRRTGEPRNRKTPPHPPEGGRTGGEVFVQETHTTERGRSRTRVVRVDVAAIRRELAPPGSEHREAWVQARRLMLGTVGESTFDIWLAPLELIALDAAGLLVLTGPVVLLSWVQKRFGPLISRSCEDCGRRVRFASPQERLAIESNPKPSTRSSEEPMMNRRVS